MESFSAFLSKMRLLINPICYRSSFSRFENCYNLFKVTRLCNLEGYSFKCVYNAGLRLEILRSYVIVRFYCVWLSDSDINSSMRMNGDQIVEYLAFKTRQDNIDNYVVFNYGSLYNLMHYIKYDLICILMHNSNLNFLSYSSSDIEFGDIIDSEGIGDSILNE